MGIPIPIIGWSDQRRKSNYASFQSLQALGYQSLGFTVWILSYLVIVILASIVLLVMLGPATTDNENLQPWVVVLLIVMFGPLVIYFLLPILAAAACALGRDFRYPVMGQRLARYLDYDPARAADEQTWLVEEHEFRWVAAMGHFSILILFWGMLAPLTAWALYGKRSPFLRFQSVQTLGYQAGATVLAFAALFMYLFGALLFIAWTGVMGASNLDSSMGILSIVVFGVFLLLSFLIILLTPLLHVLGQWAGYRLLKGDDYRYPVLGKLVDKWLFSRRQ